MVRHLVLAEVRAEVLSLDLHLSPAAAALAVKLPLSRPARDEVQCPSCSNNLFALEVEDLFKASLFGSNFADSLSLFDSSGFCCL